MVLNEELLEKAQAEAQKLAEAEKQISLAKAEYHTVVRRLHLAGGSLREIAQALGISHQRVQQIVNEAGGSWWQRWRSRQVKKDAVCSFCKLPPSEVAKLVAGPNVYICNSCTSIAEKTLEGGGSSEKVFSSVAEKKSRIKCSFCSKKSTENRRLVTGKMGGVCSDCLKLCRQFIDGDKN